MAAGSLLDDTESCVSVDTADGEDWTRHRESETRLL